MIFEERLVEVALRDFGQIRVVRIGGSRGRGDATAHSDWDVFLVIDTSAAGWIELLNVAVAFIRTVDTPTVLRQPYWVPYYGYSASAFYPSVGAVDFNIRSSDDVLANYMLGAGTRVLLDRDGAMPAAIDLSSSLALPSVEFADRFATRIWFTYLRAAKELKRRRLQQYKKLCREAVEYQAGLARLVADIPPPGLDFTQPLRGIEELPSSSGGSQILELLNEIDALGGSAIANYISHLEVALQTASEFIAMARRSGLLTQTTLDDIGLSALATEISLILNPETTSPHAVPYEADAKADGSPK
jgi:hypothetical protein